METQERDSGQPKAGLVVPSFAFNRSQRTRGVYVTRGDNKCQFDEPSASPSPEATTDPFSNPSPVTSQDVGKPSCELLQSPTESSDSLSGGGSEPKARQQRRITPTLFLPLNGEGQDKGVLKLHVEAGGGGITGGDGDEEGVLSLCQKTWGPSDNPFVKQQQSRCNQRPSFSCPNSPTNVSGLEATFLEVVGVQATINGLNRFSQCVMPGALHLQKFHEIDLYANRSDFTTIYLTENSVLGIDYKEMKFLGSGGNGMVYSYGNYAIKEARFCKKILNIVRELDHPNLVRLLGVTLLGPFSEACYLIMPLMTYDLRRALYPITLVQLAKDSDEEAWMIVKSNVKYILGEVLKALSYLDNNSVQHGDIKEKNILIKKTCCCFDILHCTCSIDSGAKYRVFVTDYDYVRKCHSKATNLFYYRENCHVQNYTGGTPSYRAKEESFIFCEEDAHQGRRLGGHSSDMYSFGVLLLRMCIGEGTSKDHVDANILVEQLHTSKLAYEGGAVFNLLMLIKLSEAARRYRGSRMNFLADIVTQCTKPNPSNRPTAHELLKKVEAF